MTKCIISYLRYTACFRASAEQGLLAHPKMAIVTTELYHQFMKDMRGLRRVDIN